MSTQDQSLLISLKPLFEEAEEKGLWFYHESHEVGQIWCSPEYLRLQQSEGKMIWSPEHWELRNPLYYMKSLHMKAEAIVNEYNTMAKRMRLEQTLALAPISSNPADADQNP